MHVTGIDGSGPDVRVGPVRHHPSSPRHPY
jgi:hypothetical protein